ncbi:MAG: YIP1 family protein [Litoreibacter sp.]|nr:YIP1 family protein [Litoreibacter sp.]
MSTVSAILRSYRAPREVIRTHRAGGADEATGLTWLFVACILFFVAELPELSRQAHFAQLEGVETPFSSLALPTFYGTVLLAPLMFVLLAGLAQLVARAAGGQGRWLDGRLAMFWSLLCVSPVVLLQGLVGGFIGAGPGLTFVSLLVFVVFLYLWLNCLIALNAKEKAEPV